MRILQIHVVVLLGRCCGPLGRDPSHKSVMTDREREVAKFETQTARATQQGSN